MNKTVTVLHCNKCGAEWEARVAQPIQCPRCKSLAWNKPVKVQA